MARSNGVEQASQVSQAKMERKIIIGIIALVLLAITIGEGIAQVLNPRDDAEAQLAIMKGQQVSVGAITIKSTQGLLDAGDRHYTIVCFKALYTFRGFNDFTDGCIRMADGASQADVTRDITAYTKGDAQRQYPLEVRYIKSIDELPVSTTTISVII